MYCLDANVWIYFLDETLEEHEDVASAVIPLLEEKPLFTTTVLQMEVVHYLHTQLSDPEPAIDRFLALEDVLVSELSPRDVDVSATILRTHPHTGIGGRDATVLAAMRRHDVSRLLTHDTGLKRTAAELEWLEVTDPVDAETEPR